MCAICRQKMFSFKIPRMLKDAFVVKYLRNRLHYTRFLLLLIWISFLECNFNVHATNFKIQIFPKLCIANTWFRGFASFLFVYNQSHFFNCTATCSTPNVPCILRAFLLRNTETCAIFLVCYGSRLL